MSEVLKGSISYFKTCSAMTLPEEMNLSCVR